MDIKHYRGLFCLTMLLFGVVCFSGCSAKGIQYVRKDEPAPGKATIYAMRNRQFQAGGAEIELYDGPVHVGKLGKNDYLVWSRPTGTAELYAYFPVNTAIRPVPLTLNVTEAKSYYVAIGTLLHFTVPGHVALQEISNSKANEIMGSIDLAPQIDNAATFDKIVAATDNWPGPGNRESRWKAAWPQIRKGMSMEELQSIGIFPLDAYFPPGGWLEGSVKVVYPDGSMETIHKDSHAFDYFKRTMTVTQQSISITANSYFSQSSFFYISEKPIVSVKDEVSFGFMGHRIRLVNNKVVGF